MREKGENIGQVGLKFSTNGGKRITWPEMTVVFVMDGTERKKNPPSKKDLGGGDSGNEKKKSPMVTYDRWKGFCWEKGGETSLGGGRVGVQGLIDVYRKKGDIKFEGVRKSFWRRWLGGKKESQGGKTSSMLIKKGTEKWPRRGGCSQIRRVHKRGRH